MNNTLKFRSSPCKNCKDRWIDEITLERCHSKCERYKAFREVMDKKKDKDIVYAGYISERRKR